MDVLMKIEFLNENFTKAQITRRMWPRFWRQLVARVELRAIGEDLLADCPWYYVGTEIEVEGEHSFRPFYPTYWMGRQGALHKARETAQANVEKQRRLASIEASLRKRIQQAKKAHSQWEEV